MAHPPKAKPTVRTSVGLRPAHSARTAWSGSKRKPRPYKRKPKARILKDGSVAEWVIQREILNWLESTEILHWRQNAGVAQIGPRRVNLGPDGISDIVVVVPPTGRFLALEVKSANGRQESDQKAFQAKLEASGGIYRLVRTLDQAMTAVAEAMGRESGRVGVLRTN